MEKKNFDKYGRYRARTIAFRASENEIKAIDEMVALSGKLKREYLLDRALQRDIVVLGNPRVFKALRTKMEEIVEELKRISSVGEVTQPFLETVEFVARLCYEMNNSENEKETME